MIVAGNAIGVEHAAGTDRARQEQARRIDLCRQFPRFAAEHDRRDGSRAAPASKLTFVPYPGAPPALAGRDRRPRIAAWSRASRAFVGAMAVATSIKPLAITSPKPAAELSGSADRRRRRVPGYQLARLVRASGAQPACRTTWCARSMPTCAPCSTCPRCGRALRDAPPTYVRHLSPAETGNFIRAEQQAWRPVVKQFGVTTQ